ncbi:unnamed protein product, partial [Ixodes hexagonus]
SRSYLSRALGATLATLSGVCLTVVGLVWLQWDLVEVPVHGVGTVRGFRFFVEGRRLYAFFGVSFALPPLREHRFRRPRGTSAHVIRATRKRPGCFSTNAAWFSGDSRVRDGGEVSEDCLHVNVWTPCTWVTEPNCRKTVVVFLFATGFQSGGNNRYDGALFAALGDVVFVAPNFRLGAFGFLGTASAQLGNQDAPGSAALYDQKLAVEWVLDHIEFFGGDKSNVVLMGSATGAWSIGAQMLSTSPVWRWHFSRLILQSESPFRR